ncbi:MAG: hypothetical protein J6K17_13210 [Oscillospiraceae bacterium]|nr:hypothetical protein [Oscillospiraceae bacterium]
MEFAADKYCAKFGGVKIFVEEYSFARNAAVGETVLTNGSAALYNGGGKSARITVSGTAENPCTHLLDGLLLNATAVDFEYGGMIFKEAVLVSYTCKGKSGQSEVVTAEFACEAAVSEKAVEA